MEIYRKFTKDVGFVAISELILKIKPIIFLPIITKTLGASDYGVYTTLFVTIAFLIPFSIFRLNESIVRLLPSVKDKKKISTSISSITVFVLLISLFLAFVLFLSSDLLAKTFFGDPNSTEIIKVGVFILPLTALLRIGFAFFRMQQRILIYSILRVVNAFAPILLAVIFLLNGFGLLYVIYSYIIVEVICLFVTLPWVFREIGFSLPKISVLKPYLKFGIPLIAVAVSVTTLQIGDRYVIGYLMDSTAVGIYAVAYNLGALVLMLLFPITATILSPLSKAYDEGKLQQVRNYLTYSIRYFLMISIPAAVGLSIVAMPAIKSLTTSEFLTGALGVTAVVAISNVAYGLYVILSRILFLVKKTTLAALLLGIFAALNIGLNILLVPSLGIMGAAIATLICFLLLLVATAITTRSYIQIPIDLIFLGKSILAALLMGLIVFYISPKGWMNLAVVAVLGAAIYFGLLFVFRAFEKNELKFFKSFLTKQEVLE